MEKIFLEDGLTLYKKTGIGQYTENLIHMLKELGYEVILPRKYFLEKIKNASVKRILYVLWLNTIFPFLLLCSGAEKVIFTNYLTPLFKIPSKKYYPVIHDLWAIKFPDTMSKTKREYQIWILKVIKNTYYKIITVSENVKKEILNYYKCSDNVGIIYNSFSFGENPSISLLKSEEANLLDKYKVKNKKYILSVGSLNKRKNIQTLIDAYNKIKTDVKLLIVGNDENNKFSNINSNIIFTGYISDEDLKVLYKHAKLFVFPSIYEGFGIPIIDAQSFGIPVLCSDIEVFKEIGEKSVEFISKDYSDFSLKLESLINNENRLKELQTLGYENINKFSKQILLKQIKEVLNA